MIEKKTVIDHIGVTRAGHIEIRFGLLLLEDGEEISRQWHRTVIEPGADIDNVIAMVNTHLTTRMRANEIDAGRMPLLKNLCRLVHTPEVVAKYRADLAANADQELRRK